MTVNDTPDGDFYDPTTKCPANVFSFWNADEIRLAFSPAVRQRLFQPEQLPLEAEINPATLVRRHAGLQMPPLVHTTPSEVERLRHRLTHVAIQETQVVHTGLCIHQRGFHVQRLVQNKMIHRRV